MASPTITAPGNILNVLGASSGTGAANLLTPDPREVWVAASPSGQVLYDFGSPQPFDSVFLGFTNAQPGASWGIFTSNDGATYTTVSSLAIIEPAVPYGFDGSIGRRVHLYRKFPAPLTARYVIVGVDQAGSGLPNLRAGILVVNRCFQPAWPQELGGGRMVIDTGQRDRLPGGGFSFSDGVIKDAFQLTLGDLSDAELSVLYAMVRQRGSGGRWCSSRIPTIPPA